MGVEWKELCKADGISDAVSTTFGTRTAWVLASAGLSLPVIGALHGHSQPQTTARYAHLLDDPLRAATEHVGVIIAGGGLTADVVSIKKQL